MTDKIQIDQSIQIPEVEVIWPEVGSKWRDRKHPERVLTVTEIRKKCGLGRNVVGTVEHSGVIAINHRGVFGQGPYAADLQTFQIIWESIL